MPDSSRQTVTRRERCPLCGGGALHDHLDLDSLKVVRCEACDFLFTQDILPEADLAEFYRSGYGGIRHKQGQTVNAIASVHVLKRLLPDPKALGSVLDIGSGYGFFLNGAREAFGWTPTGAELSTFEKEHANSELGIETFGDVAEIPEGKTFDVVTAFEVIEHIESPKDFVRMMYERTAPGGYIVIGTDNFECAIVRALGENFPKWIPHQHISLFSDKTLPKVFDGLPVEIAGMASVDPWPLLLRRALWQISGKRVGGSPYRLADQIETENSRPYRFYGPRLALESIWLAVAMSPKLDGEMMYLAARKPA